MKCKNKFCYRDHLALVVLGILSSCCFYISFFFFSCSLHHLKFNQFLLSFSIAMFWEKERAKKSKRQLMLNLATMYFRRLLLLLLFVQTKSVRMPSSPTLNIFNLKCSTRQNIAYLPFWLFDSISIYGPYSLMVESLSLMYMHSTAKCIGRERKKHTYTLR